MLNSEQDFLTPSVKSQGENVFKKTWELRRTTSFTPCIKVRISMSDIKRRPRVQLVNET
jgi:hypothetical protein